MDAVIRKAEPQDIQAIQHVAKESWHDTYQYLIPQGIQDQFLSQAYSDEFLLKRIQQSVFFVAQQNDEVVGYANAFPKGDKADLSAIYLKPQVQGQKIGSRLLTALVGALEGVEEIYVEVEKGNKSGETFYHAKGFTLVDEYEDHLSGHALQTKQMVLSKVK